MPRLNVMRRADFAWSPPGGKKRWRSRAALGLPKILVGTATRGQTGYANIQARSLSSHVASNDLVIAQPPG